MKEQVLKILELCLQLKAEKGYDIFFSYFPNAPILRVGHSKRLKWGKYEDNFYYNVHVYLSKEMYSPEKTEEVIKHLEELCER